ncbi:NDP-sugar synthase [Kiritimatiellaeota bacterium B1221]|nr:NDP-sugar synthase [Kiritimatiellaeota bacterium B1221]
MKALLHTGGSLAWLPDPEERPWILLPVGNRPILEYWVECCVDLGIRDIRLVLGNGGYLIEEYAGDGERWGVQISYSFQKEGEEPDRFPLRNPDLWKDGVLYLRQPSFPLRQQKSISALAAGESCRLGAGEIDYGFYSADSAHLTPFLAGQSPSALPESSTGFSAYGIESAKSYFDLNLRIIQGEISHYLAPGYELSEGSHIGYNVVIPPSVIMEPPVMIGNDVRLSPLNAIGPHAVIGNSVVIDAQTELKDCVILDGSYIGRNLSIEQKIVAGNLLIDPDTGDSLRLDDSLLLGDVGKSTPLSDFMNIFFGQVFSFILWLLFLPGFFVFYSLIRLTGSGNYTKKTILDARKQPRMCPEFVRVKKNIFTGCFQGLSLDRWPLLVSVLRKQLYLCGHAPITPEDAEDRFEKIPEYFPGVFYDELLLPQQPSSLILNVYALNYIKNRKLTGEISLFFRVGLQRLLRKMSNMEEG